MNGVFKQVVAAFLVVAGLFLVNTVAYADPQEDRKHREEVQRYTEQIKQNPNDANAYFQRGLAYRGLKQYEQAIRDYNKVIELKPNWSAPYANMGGCFANLGQNYLAIDACNKALALDPNNAAAYNNRGWAYYNLKQYDQAIQDFDKALELDPNDPNYTIAKNNRKLCYDALDTPEAPN